MVSWGLSGLGLPLPRGPLTSPIRGPRGHVHQVPSRRWAASASAMVSASAGVSRLSLALFGLAWLGLVRFGSIWLVLGLAGLAGLALLTTFCNFSSSVIASCQAVGCSGRRETPAELRQAVGGRDQWRHCQPQGPPHQDALDEDGRGPQRPCQKRAPASLQLR